MTYCLPGQHFLLFSSLAVLDIVCSFVMKSTIFKKRKFQVFCVQNLKKPKSEITKINDLPSDVFRSLLNLEHKVFDYFILRFQNVYDLRILEYFMLASICKPKQ